MQISQSDVVRVRRARWRIVDLRPYVHCELLTLVGAGPSNLGNVRHVLRPFDVVARLERREQPTRVSLRWWRRACRALVAADTPPGGLRCAASARMDLLPHQLEPALAIVRGAGCRVLLADEVGLGKTVQAGLMAAELSARGAADRVLVVTPAGLRDQWARELQERFAFIPVVVDVRKLRQTAAALPVGANPWQAIPFAIVSVDYLRRPDVLADVAACRWDLVVIDEAHGAARDSERHAAIAALTVRAPYVVLVTATPHNGDREAFRSLCNLGAIANESLLIFRRTRRDVGLAVRRHVHRLFVRLNAAEAHMHRRLDEFARAIRRANPPNPANRANPENPENPANLGVSLALSVLRKRASSSARSLQRSVERRLDALTSNAQPAAQLPLPLADPAGELISEDEPPPWSPLMTLGDPQRERRVLQALRKAAEAAAGQETKVATLRRLLRRVNEPLVVFTEYRDTLLHLQASLGEPSLVLHGGLSRDERLRVIEQFIAGAVRILLATDAAGEGLNLHAACRLVVNLELPWNPMRLEQRIGRVDRIGQRRTVHVLHLIGRGTRESQMLKRLQTRLAHAGADVGSADPLGTDRESSTTERLPLSATALSLAREAFGEAARIAAARALVRPGDQQALERLECEGPAVATSHRWKTRAAIGTRTLLLCRATSMDATGRTVASRLVALVVDRRDVDRVKGSIATYIDRAIAAWRHDVEDVHRAFILTRLLREQHIASLRPSIVSMFQPGLFDRRVEHAQMAMVAAERDSRDDHAGRLAALETALQPASAAPQLLLVLTTY
nr:RNA polymerase-associated protein RapA [uncultured bacterium]